MEAPSAWTPAVAEFLSLFSLDELSFDAASGSPAVDFIDETSEPEAQGLASAAAEWQAMAIRQRVLRVTAETDNVALRGLAAAQRKRARKMARLVSRASEALERALPPAEAVSHGLVGYSGPLSDPFAQLQSLERLVEQATQVFAACAFQRRDVSSLQDAFFKTSDPSTDGVELELQLSWALPFDVGTVAETFWRKPAQGSANGKVMKLMVLHQDENAKVCRFISTPVEETALPLSHGQVAMRRFLSTKVGNEGQLIVTAISAHSMDGTDVRGVVQSQEWMRFEPVRRDLGPSTTALCRVHWCRRLRVRPYKYERMTLIERRKWTHAMVTGPTRHQIERSLQRKIQEAENWLLAN